MINMTGANEHKWMQPRAKVQHLPVLADGQAAGFCGQSQGGGEKDTGAREICLNFKERELVVIH